MIKNYIISALRNMARSKLYTFINIFCLAIGITGAIFIVMFLDHEISHDKHHKNHDRIYRLEGNYFVGGSVSELALTAFPLGPALKEEFSEIKEYVRFFSQTDMMVHVDDRDFVENEFYYTDSTVFNVFTHPFIHGDPASALTEPNSIVLTQSLSQKYFGDDIPLDKTLKINTEKFRVTGVIEDLPTNSHLKFSALLSIITHDNNIVYSLSPQLFWNINVNFTYVLMHKDNDISSVLNNMEAFDQKYIAPFGDVLGAKARFVATPLSETHFRKIQGGLATGNKINLVIFSIVALFLIIIAAVNYTNLATARASKRAREIAMRKVAGATRTQLIFQFLAESTLVAITSLLLSLLIVELFLPGFNMLANGSYSLSNILNARIFPRILIIALGTGIISGIYPAFYLSRLQPAIIFKGHYKLNGGSGILRKFLVIFQFSISILLIAGTITVKRQIDYLQKKDLGFTHENRMVVTINDIAQREKVKSLQSTLEQNPMILNSALSLSIPGTGFNKNAIRVEMNNEMVESAITTNFIDHNFLDLLKIPIVKGRNFNPEMVSDAENAVIVNQTAVRFFGWDDDPLGKTIQWLFSEDGEPQMTLQVIGVTADYNFATLQNPIEPIMLLLAAEPVYHRSLTVEYLPQHASEVHAYLEQTVREFDPTRIPNIFSLDHGFIDEFSAEERLARIFSIFALVCILISFLGLFGLSSYLTDQRKKEIGVRKVLGSSGWSILAMFYKEFSWLVIVAVILAAPVSWILMERWLVEFVYHKPMNLQPIFISALWALLVALFTVSYHTLKASMLNPVEAIRSE